MWPELCLNIKVNITVYLNHPGPQLPLTCRYNSKTSWIGGCVYSVVVRQENILRKRQGVLGGIDHYYHFVICLYNTALPIGNIRFIQQVFWTTRTVVYLHQTSYFPYILVPMMYIPKDQYIPKQEYGNLIIHFNPSDCIFLFH